MSILIKKLFKLEKQTKDLRGQKQSSERKLYFANATYKFFYFVKCKINLLEINIGRYY